MDRDQHKEAFEAFAERVLDRFSTVESVVLFGSVARGEHGKYSDVDVLVRVTDLSDREAIEEVALDTTSEYGIPVTPVVITTDTEQTSFLNTVATEGIEYVRG